MSYLERQFGEVSVEGMRALKKFGAQDHLTDLEWFAVLAEEVGEVAKDVTQREVRPVGAHPGMFELRAEIVQVAAVALRWLDAIDHRP